MNLLDLINHKRAKRYADGGPVFPSMPIAARMRQAQDIAGRAAQVQGGAFNTTPPPLASLDESQAGQITPGAVTPQSQEVNETGMAPRLLEAGTHDVAGGFESALAATTAALGGDALAGTLHKAAEEHAARAAALTPDQIQNVGDIHSLGDAGQYVFGQAVRGAPMLGAMALGGAAARTMGAPALAGVAAPSMALNTGAAYQQMADADPAAATSQRTGAHALLAGAGGAALDTLAYGYAAKLSPFAKGALAKTLSTSLPGHVLRSALVEGATGAARQYVNTVATKQLLGNPDMFGLTPEDVASLENAAAQNAAATSPLAVPGHFAHGIGRGIDATMDLAGKGLKAAGFGEKPDAPPAAPAPVAEDPSLLDRAGGALAQAAAHPAVGKAVDLAAAGYGAAKTAMSGLADKVADHSSAIGAGMDAATAALNKYATSKPEIRAAVDGLSEALKPAEEPGVKQSLNSPLTPEQRTLRDSFRSDNPNLSINDGIALAKIFEPLSLDNKAFDAALAQPGVADHIAALTGRAPDDFKQYVQSELGRRTPDTGIETPDKMAQHNVMDADEKGVDGIAAEQGEELHNIDTSDVLNAVDHPDQTGVDNPRMDPEAFGKMLLTDDQKAKKHTGNAWVNVTRTTKDAATGEMIGAPVTEPKQINFTNVATAWRDRTKAQPGRTQQHNMDTNFKEGLSSMLNGWQEVGEHVDPATGEKKATTVEVKVQPAKQHTEDGQVTAVDRADMAGWLRPDSVVGTNGSLRTFAKVEKSGQVNQPVDVHGAVNDFYSAKDNPQDKAGAADKVAAAVADRVRDRLNDYKPEDQQRTMDRTHSYLLNPLAYDGDPRAAIKAGVLPEVATLPHEVLSAAKAGLISRLSDLEQHEVQSAQQTETESSVDNPNHNAEQGVEDASKEKVTEDLSGQHINYKETEAAGRRALQNVDTSAQVPADRNTTDELKRKYAEATTVPGKAIARKALEAATKKAKPAR